MSVWREEERVKGARPRFATATAMSTWTVTAIPERVHAHAKTRTHTSVLSANSRHSRAAPAGQSGTIAVAAAALMRSGLLPATSARRTIERTGRTKERTDARGLTGARCLARCGGAGENRLTVLVGLARAVLPATAVGETRPSDRASEGAPRPETAVEAGLAAASARARRSDDCHQNETACALPGPCCIISPRSWRGNRPRGPDRECDGDGDGDFDLDRDRDPRTRSPNSTPSSTAHPLDAPRLPVQRNSSECEPRRASCSTSASSFR